MRPHPLTVCAVSLAALTLPVASPSMAGARVTGPAPAHLAAPVQARQQARTKPCFTNTNDDTGDALTSQNFEAAFDSFDSFAADDFTLRKRCRLTAVDVVGQYYNGSGPAVSENVTIYDDHHGVPGNVVAAQTQTGADSAGTFAISLSPVVDLAPGTYWVDVQANLDFSAGGQWGWENTSNKRGSAAQWENPGDGFETGCTTYRKLQTCLAAPGPDLMFSIRG